MARNEGLPSLGLGELLNLLPGVRELHSKNRAQPESSWGPWMPACRKGVHLKLTEIYFLYSVTCKSISTLNDHRKMSYNYSKPESDSQYGSMSLSMLCSFFFLLCRNQTAGHGEHMCAQPQSLWIFLIYGAPAVNEAPAAESQQSMSILMTPCHRMSSSQDLATLFSHSR